jgi:hypothetical protein
MTSSLSDSISVALQLSPIIAALIMPPIDRHPTLMRDAPLLPDLEDLLARFHDWLQLKLKRVFAIDLYTFRERLIFSEKAFKSRRWTAVTHMFVHGSYAHLGGNLFSLALSSRQPWKKVGPLAFWGVFFLGGAAAAVNSPLKRLQTKKQVSHRLSFPGLPTSWVPESLRRGVDWWREHATSKLTNAVRPHLQYVGCSAGVSAIAGLNFGIVLETLGDCLSGRGNTTAG